MRTLWKLALGAVSLGLLAGCQPYDGYGGGYYGGGVSYDYGGGYCDGFGCPDNYWDQPLYYGSVYYGGRWNNGPFYYRDWNGGRQYWLGGNWRNDGWRGARPPQYRDGRYGPALGREWYRNNRPDRDGRPGFNRPDRPRGERPDRGTPPQQAQQPQTPRPDRFQRDRAPQQPQGGGERRGGRFGGNR